MPADKYDKLGPLFADVGGELAKIVAGDPDGTFLYVEAGEGWLSCGVFKEDGGSVRYYRPTSDLTDLLFEAWHTDEPNKRWAVMEYDVVGTKFDARFKFPDEVDVESFEMDREAIALRNRFGDKPVIYPAWPPEQE